MEVSKTQTVENSYWRKVVKWSLKNSLFGSPEEGGKRDEPSS